VIAIATAMLDIPNNCNSGGNAINGWLDVIKTAIHAKIIIATSNTTNLIKVFIYSVLKIYPY